MGAGNPFRSGFERFLNGFLFPRQLVPPLSNVGRLEERIERMWLPTPHGDVEGWLLLGEGVSPQRPAPLVVFAHGNGELIDYWPEALADYLDLGLNLFLPEYRGYGRSAGAPCQRDLVHDLHGWLDRVGARPEVDTRRLVYHGRSIGGGVVCALAAEQPPAALILQSTFTCVADVARRFGVPRALVGPTFDNLTVVRQADWPTLVMHGTRDRLIPFDHAQRLCAACDHAELHAFEADHNSPFDRRRYWQTIQDFFERHRLLDPRGSEPHTQAGQGPRE